MYFYAASHQAVRSISESIRAVSPVIRVMDVHYYSFKEFELDYDNLKYLLDVSMHERTGRLETDGQYPKYLPQEEIASFRDRKVILSLW